MAPLNGDVENGDVEKELRGNPEPAADENMGEYGNLVRYISTYKDGRRGSTVSSIVNDEEPKKKFWQKKSKGTDGVFDTPDEWLNTDMKQGISDHDVETRRKKTGWNELTTEHTNLFIQFLSYFQGPILYGKSLPLLSSPRA